MSPEKTNEVDALHDASHRLMIFLQREGIIDVGTNKADRAKALELAQELLGLHPADPDLAIRLHTLSGEEKFELALMFQREVVRVTRGEQRVSEIVSQEKKRSLVFTGLLERMRQTVEGFDQYVDSIPYAASYLAHVGIGGFFSGDEENPINEMSDDVLIERLYEELEFKIDSEEEGDTTGGKNVKFLARLKLAIKTFIDRKKIGPTNRALRADYAVRDQERLDLVGDWGVVCGKIKGAAEKYNKTSFKEEDIDDFVGELRTSVRDLGLKRLKLTVPQMDRDFKELSDKLHTAFSDAEELDKDAVLKIVDNHFYIFKLNIGNPGLYGQTPPEQMVEAVRAKITENSGYSDQLGDPAYRKQIAEYYSLYFKNKGANIPEGAITADNVIMGNGASEIIEMFILASLSNSDNAVGISPIYPLYPSIMKMIGKDLNTAPMECSDGEWKFNVNNLEAKVNVHTKVMFLNSPNNPAGIIFNKDDMRKALEIAKKYDLFVISDEIYSADIYDPEDEDDFCSIGELAYEMGVPSLLINGISKGFGKAAGYRQGWGVVIDRDGKIQNLFDAVKTLAGKRLCPNVPCQAAIGPLMDDLIKLEERKAQGGEVSIDGLKTLEYLEGLKDLTNKQREAACRVFNVGSLEMVEPRGAYYGFFKVKGIEDHETERRFAKELLEKRRVHLVPGKGFEYPVPGYFRMVFLDEADNITRAGEVVDKFAREEFDFNL